MKRTNTKGFTLVELLVVISIIALLLSILMPSLTKARNSAKTVVCMSNLKQLALAYCMYTDDNGGYFEDGVTSMWPVTLSKYFSDINKLRCCPIAPGPSNPLDAINSKYSGYGGPKKYWLWSHNGFRPFQYGSYALNCWTAANAKGWPREWGDSANLWGKANQKGANNIPILADGYWMGGMPLETDQPSLYPDKMVNPLHSMQRFCSNRHDNKTNVAFMDWSVRSVGLKQLWKLKWHKNYNVNAKDPDWSRAPWINK